MVRTPGFHPEDPGSIPHAGDFFKILILIHIFNLVPIVWAPHIIAFNTVWVLKIFYKVQTDKNKTFVMIHEGCAELSHFQVHCISIRARFILEFQVGNSNY